MKKNRFFLAGLPVIALALGMMITGCDDGSTDDTETTALIDIDGINSTELWNAAITLIKTGASKRYRLNITGSFDAAGVNDATFGTITGLSVEIRGQETANLKMSLTSDGHMFRIGTDQHLTLKDITLQGKTDNNTPLVYVYQGGTLEMTGSAAVSGNETSSTGGGVYISNNSTMTMSGNAAISGNKANSYGGGVYISNNSTMTMSDDAAISGNKANSYGGGVYISNNSTMTMNGDAAISGNSATSYGGGVYISKNSTMTMNDNAAISGNSATDKGGGVGMFSDGTFRMAGGTVYGNSETDANKKNTAPNGGASLYSSGDTAQYGTFNGGAWVSNGTLSTGDNTIKVVNGVRQ